MGHAEKIYKAAQKGDTAVLKEYTGELDRYIQNGRTPLMQAVYDGNFRAVQCLVEHGANPEHYNEYGRTAYDYAYSDQSTNILIYLRRLKEDGWLPCSDHAVDHVSYLSKDGIQIRDRFNLRAEERTRLTINLTNTKFTTTLTKFSDIGPAELQEAAKHLEEFTGKSTYSNLRKYRVSTRRKQGPGQG